MYTQTIPQENKLEHWEDFKLDVTKYSLKVATHLSRMKNYRKESLLKQLDIALGQKQAQTEIDYIEKQ